MIKQFCSLKILMKENKELREEKNKEELDKFNSIQTLNTKLKTNNFSILNDGGALLLKGASILVTAYYLNENFLSIKEISTEVDKGIENLEALGYSGVGIMLFNTLAKLSSTYKAFKDPESFESNKLLNEKAKMLKEFFKEDSIMKNLEESDILAIGACYSHLKKESYKNKVGAAMSFYKIGLILSDKSSVCRNIYKICSNKKELELKDPAHNRKTIDFIENTINPHDFKKLGIEKDMDIYKEWVMEKGEGDITDFSINTYLSTKLEAAFVQTAKEKEREDVYRLNYLFISRSLEDKDYFSKNLNKIEDFNEGQTKNLKKDEQDPVLNKLKDIIEELGQDKYSKKDLIVLEKEMNELSTCKEDNILDVVKKNFIRDIKYDALIKKEELILNDFVKNQMGVKSEKPKRDSERLTQASKRYRKGVKSIEKTCKKREEKLIESIKEDLKNNKKEKNESFEGYRNKTSYNFSHNK